MEKISEYGGFLRGVLNSLILVRFRVPFWDADATVWLSLGPGSLHNCNLKARGGPECG